MNEKEVLNRIIPINPKLNLCLHYIRTGLNVIIFISTTFLPQTYHKKICLKGGELSETPFLNNIKLCLVSYQQLQIFISTFKMRKTHLNAHANRNLIAD